jgi:hypothetical protein
MNILQAIDDPKVLGQHFRAGSWKRRVCLWPHCLRYR